MMRHHNNGLRKICDCPRRAWPKCKHPWHFNFKAPDKVAPNGSIVAGTMYRFSLDKHLGKHVDNKSDAEDAARDIRIAIKAGTFGQPAPRSGMTLRQLADAYFERSVQVKHPDTAAEYEAGLRVICGTPLPRPTGGALPFGEWCLSDIVTDTIERYREARRARGTGPGGASRSLARLRAVYNWGIRVGYVERSPFKRGTEVAVTLEPASKRSRRLDADHNEEANLLDACGPHLRAVVEAAIETGMRRGEILSLQWNQVEGVTIKQDVTPPVVTWAPRATLFLPRDKTKTKQDRRIPISTRLKAILEMRRFDPAGDPHAGDRFVFGNIVGQQVVNIKRAWSAAVLRSHGHTPTYSDKKNLTPESQGAFAAIGLHFHDLRREAGSRWLEGGVPLHTVRDWLGHANISQTSTYLSGTQQTQHDAMTAYEARLAILQKIATDAKTGGRKSPPGARRAERKPNRTGPGRQSAIM